MNFTPCSALCILLLTFEVATSPVKAQSTRDLFSRPGLSIGSYHFNYYDGLYNASYKYVGDTVLCGDTLLLFALLPDNKNKFAYKIEGAKIRAANLLVPCQFGPYYYDFDLQVGDVFNAEAQSTSFTVIETGEKNLLNGETRRYLKLRNNPNPSLIIEWIEGIGDIKQGLFPGYDFEGYYRFVCARDSTGDLWYGQPTPPDLVCDSLLCPRPLVHFSWSAVDKTGQFTSQLSDADEWWWDFGDGQSSTERHPTHVYETPGCYEVQLNARAYCSHQPVTFRQSIPICINPDWSPIAAQAFPANENVWDLVFPTPDTGWARTQSRIFKTVDGGLTWTVQPLPPSQPGSTRRLNGLYMANTHLGIIPCGYQFGQAADANFLVTTDGEHWVASNVGGVKWMAGASLTENGRGYGVASYGDLYRTNNFGQTWEKSQITTTLQGFLQPEKIVPLQGDSIYILGEIELFSNLGYSSPVLMRSYNQGDHWEVVLLPDPPGIYTYHDMHFFDGLNGWLPGKEGFLLHTLDGGNNWEEVPFGAPLTLSRIDFFDALNGWAAGGELVLHTKNGGQSWERELCGYTSFITSIVATGANSALSTSLAKLLEYTPAEDPICGSSAVNESSWPLDVSAWRVSPNPAGDFLAFNRSYGEHKVAFHIFIFNNLGQLVLESDFFDAQVQLDISALKPGVYAWFISEGPSNCRAGRFVVVR